MRVVRLQIRQQRQVDRRGSTHLEQYVAERQNFHVVQGSGQRYGTARRGADQGIL